MAEDDDGTVTELVVVVELGIEVVEPSEVSEWECLKPASPSPTLEF
jgi:hypothetical protein